MNCVVTAGPTYEPLDAVRRLTNLSTGRLGTELAAYLTARGHHVTLLIGEAATYAGGRSAARVRVFSTTADLRARLERLAGRRVEAVFHAAAVSDFKFGRVFQLSAGGAPRPLPPAQKISTRRGRLLVELAPTPKIIAELRGWFPAARLCGWKYEADGGRLDAVAAARRQLADCGTDWCVANGPAYGRGYGLAGPGTLAHLAGSARLFAALERLLA